jgi:hypothetical protein
MTTKDYNKLLVQLVSVSRNADPAMVGCAIRDSLHSQASDSRRWPSDEEFLEALLAPNLFHMVVRARLKSLLVGVENYLRTDKVEGGPIRSGDPTLNIEHLMPQSWEKHWSLGRAPSETRLRERQAAIHQLGNLTLLTTKLNPSLSNNAWSKKRASIAKQTLLRLSTSSVLTAPEGVTTMSDVEWATDWDEERISLRSRWMAEQAIQTWPKLS